MLSRIIKFNKLLITAFIPGITTREKDNADPSSPTAKKISEENKKIKETGLDRLYNMFSYDEFGRPSAELVNIWHVMMLSMVVGAGIGGYVRSRVSFMDFMERNDATSFTSHLDAKKKLQDKVTTGFARGAWQWGWRLTAFTGCYTTTSSMISIYRGKHGIMEHIIAGGLTGATYKFNLGVRGVVVGGTLGVFLGTLSGVTIWAIMKTTGISLTDVKNQSYAFHNSREGAFEERIKEYYAAKEPDIINDYQAKKGHTNINLDSIEIAPTDVKQ